MNAATKPESVSSDNYLDDARVGRPHLSATGQEPPQPEVRHCARLFRTRLRTEGRQHPVDGRPECRRDRGELRADRLQR